MFSEWRSTLTQIRGNANLVSRNYVFYTKYLLTYLRHENIHRDAIRFLLTSAKIELHPDEYFHGASK